MKWHHLALPVLALAAAACSANENPAAGGAEALAAAREQVTQRFNAYLEIPRNANVAAIPGFWTPDGRLMEPEMAMSPTELQTMATGFFETSKVTDLQLNPTETVAHDGGRCCAVGDG